MRLSVPPEPQTAVHLLRALLRESSYLPDVASRLYFRQYILSRYRRYQLPTNAPPSPHFEKRAHLILNRTPQLLKGARKGLRFLRRANNGDLKAIYRILLCTYGRIGKRRRLLLQDIINTEPTAAKLNGSTLKEILTTSKRLPKTSFPKAYNAKFLEIYGQPTVKNAHTLGYDVSDNNPRLRALLKSHTLLNIIDPIRPKLKNTAIESPQVNAWGRPMPRKRTINIIKRGYAKTLHKVLPPLPESEFQTLRSLACGSVPWQCVKKRVSGTVRATLESKPSHECRLNSTEPSSLASEGILYQVLCATPQIYTHSDAERNHSVTHRQMRRLWSKVLSQVPLIKWNGIFGKWTVEWGSTHNQKAKLFPTDDLALFEDYTGKQ